MGTRRAVCGVVWVYLWNNCASRCEAEAAEPSDLSAAGQHSGFSFGFANRNRKRCCWLYL